MIFVYPAQKRLRLPQDIVSAAAPLGTKYGCGGVPRPAPALPEKSGIASKGQIWYTELVIEV